ncbi:MAG: hypothetical protein HYR72_15300 [Deltaproteobacteria bacterium]|nr:hypothetical protein [Deltaproteobacteria bacterium]MBI3390167.1 hypothetical protein [Deltaproteobacteria bacterium]
MKIFLRISLIALLMSFAAGTIVRDVVAQQVPAEEEMQPPDSPATDEASGNAEAGLPAVEPGPADLDEPAVEPPAEPEVPEAE